MVKVAVACLVSGCMIGGGPVVAVRSSGQIAVGLDGASNVAILGLQGGASFPVGDGDPIKYAGLRGFFPIHNQDNSDYGYGSGAGEWLGASFGGASDGKSTDYLLAMWPMYMRALGTGSCGTPNLVFSVELGVRWIGVAELFFAPKLNVLALPCSGG